MALPEFDADEFEAEGMTRDGVVAALEQMQSNTWLPPAIPIWNRQF
jgi:hypothetical protein